MRRRGGERWRRSPEGGCRSRIRSLVVAERRVVVGVVRGGAGGGGGQLDEEVAEVGDGAGDAERAGVAVPVLLRGAAEQRGEGRAAEELSAHGVPLHGPALLADADGHVALRHARAAAQPPRAGERGRLGVGGRGRRVRPEWLVPGGGAGVGCGHAGETPEQALHAGGSGGAGKTAGPCDGGVGRRCGAWSSWEEGTTHRAGRHGAQRSRQHAAMRLYWGWGVVAMWLPVSFYTTDRGGADGSY